MNDPYGFPDMKRLYDLAASAQLGRHDQRPYVDPEQLQEELQAAFDKVSERIKHVEAIALAQIGLHKMTLRAFIDFDLTSSDTVADRLQALSAKSKEKLTKDLLSDMAKALRDYHGPNPSTPEPHLRLVETPHAEQRTAETDDPEHPE
jgi:hypothetical protein